jgi:hypothetical protein
MYFAMQRAAEAQSLSGQPQEVLSSAMAPVRDWAETSD